MSTFTTHHSLPMPRSKESPVAHLGDARLESTVTFKHDGVFVVVKDPALAEGLEVVAEIDIVLEHGELLLRAVTNRQLHNDLDGEPQVTLYDVDDPYPEGESG